MYIRVGQCWNKVKSKRRSVGNQEKIWQIKIATKKFLGKLTFLAEVITARIIHMKGSNKIFF
jgi:hypothetical protein